MGVLTNLRFARQRARRRPARPCSHLDQIRDVTPSSAGCQPCLDLGDSWMHLRMCMTDGQVLCCDSSKNKHASRHAREHAPAHQIVRSMQPGEDWLWCYTDQTLVQAPGAPPPGGPSEIDPSPRRTQSRPEADRPPGSLRRTAMLITTTPGIEGRTMTEYLGVVTAQGVPGVNAF